MHEYLLTGRTADGQTETQIVEASSGDEAVRTFEAQGHTDIILHTGETAALLYKPSSLAGFLRPDEMVASRTMGYGRQSVLFVRKLYVKLWIVLVLLAALPLYWAVTDDDIVGWVLAAVVAAFPIILGGLMHRFGSVARYRQLLDAIGWARYDEVLRLVPGVKFKLPAFELPLRRAQAMAGLGRMADALEVYDRLDGNPDYPRPAFWGNLALIYITGRDREKALVCLERAHELAPDNPDILIDLAGQVTTVRGDLARAKGLLAAARRHVLADTAYPFYRAAEGLFAVEEKRPAEAVPCFEDAVRLTEPFLRGNPSVRYFVARLWAHLALAHAAVGDLDAAHREADRAKPVLHAHRDGTMLARLADALG